MVVQNIGNHSSPSQFSNEGCLLCFLLSRFETPLHLNIFPRTSFPKKDFQSLCKPTKQEDTSKHSRMSIDGPLQNCLLPVERGNTGEIMLNKDLSGPHVPPLLQHSSFTPVPGRQPTSPKWSDESPTSGSS